MSKKMEEMKNAIMRSGKGESSAYAIATAMEKKMKSKHKLPGKKKKK